MKVNIEMEVEYSCVGSRCTVGRRYKCSRVSKIIFFIFIRYNYDLLQTIT
jgi:hypothetical protein